MATQTVDDTRARPLSKAARQVGADAMTEQRDLLHVLLDRKLSGVAKRGVLMRIIALSDVAADLFDGRWSPDNPHALASRVYGDGTKATIQAFDALRAQGASHG
jgi:hypothetical protein